MKQGRENSPRRRLLTGQIRPAGSRWSAGKRPGSKPGDGDPDLGRGTAGGSPELGRDGDGGRVKGCASEGGRPAVVGSVGEVGENLKARATLLAGSMGSEEH
jgi:hypothetical protein